MDTDTAVAVEAATTTEAPVTASAPAAPTFVDEAKRFAVVPLEWPITFDGTTYSSITVRRLSGKQVRDFTETMRADIAAGKDVSARRFPMYDVPDAVLDGLDDDDSVKLDEVSARFLPRRYQGARASSQPQEAGDVSSPA